MNHVKLSHRKRLTLHAGRWQRAIRWAQVGESHADVCIRMTAFQLQESGEIAGLTVVTASCNSSWPKVCMWHTVLQWLHWQILTWDTSPHTHASCIVGTMADNTSHIQGVLVLQWQMM